MRKLPQYSFNEGFYIWFDINSKEEYYSTPLYMYKTDFNDDLSNYKRVIIQEKDFYKKKPAKKILLQNILQLFFILLLSNLEYF